MPVKCKRPPVETEGPFLTRGTSALTCLLMYNFYTCRSSEAELKF